MKPGSRARRNGTENRKRKSVPYTIRLTHQDRTDLGSAASSLDIPEQTIANDAIRCYLDQILPTKDFQEATTVFGTCEMKKWGTRRKVHLSISGSLLSRVEELQNGDVVLDGALHTAFRMIVQELVRRARISKRTLSIGRRKRSKAEPDSKSDPTIFFGPA
jgi:hypothetical protein